MVGQLHRNSWFIHCLRLTLLSITSPKNHKTAEKWVACLFQQKTIWQKIKKSPKPWGFFWKNCTPTFSSHTKSWLVGGFNSIWKKICSFKWIHLPQILEWNVWKKGNHHLAFHESNKWCKPFWLMIKPFWMINPHLDAFHLRLLQLPAQATRGFHRTRRIRRRPLHRGIGRGPGLGAAFAARRGGQAWAIDAQGEGQGVLREARWPKALGDFMPVSENPLI